MAIYKDLLLLNKLKNSLFIYQNCISSKPIGSVWKIKHDHSDNSGSSLTSLRISLYIDVKFGFLFYSKHSFLRENDKKFWEKMIKKRENDKKYMAKCKELLLLKKRIVWQLDQLERAVSEQEFV